MGLMLYVLLCYFYLRCLAIYFSSIIRAGMDDVFDESSGLHTDLQVGSRDWLRRSQEIRLCGERDGVFSAREESMQSKFDRGFSIGFRCVQELAVLRGRLTVFSRMESKQSSERAQILLERIKMVEDKIVTNVVSDQRQQCDSAEWRSSYEALVRDAEHVLSNVF